EREPAALPVLAGLHFFLIHTPEQRGPLPGLRRSPTALADWRDGAPLAFAPAPAEVRPALQELMGWLHAARSAVAPAIRAGVAYVRLLAIQPQETANARTACAYTALLLHRADLLPHGLPSLEAAFAADPDRYYAALLSVGPVDDAAPVVTAWLEYFLAVLRDELRAAYSSVRTAALPNDPVAPTVAASDSPAPLRLNPRQRRIVELLGVSGATLANSECQTLFGVSAMTAARDLRELVDLSLIRMYGQGRATYYAGGQGSGVRGQATAGGGQESGGSAALTATNSEPSEIFSGENKG
ncbi:MAG: Fic family protein, partial [Chloroflexota bacterium]|nr:Fic family protein [Chloroflexota bacterium]